MIKNLLLRLTPRRLSILNRYYRITQFYSFLKKTAIKGGSVSAVFILLLVSLEIFFLDFNILLTNVVELYPSKIVYSLFLLSETFLGLLPPEIFIAWASKLETPWISLFVLASLSYSGGIIAYFIGTRLFMIPSIKNYIENKIKKHIVNLRKWGGLFVLIGAVTPIPHSIVSMASGLINYKFRNYLLWALSRYVRFILYALLIFGIL